MNISVAVVAFIVADDLPESISFHAVPHLSRVPFFIGVVPVALDNHVSELISFAPATLLLDFLRPCVNRLISRKNSFLHTAEKYRIKLQSLRRMQCHQIDTSVFLIYIVCIHKQRNRIQE